MSTVSTGHQSRAVFAGLILFGALAVILPGSLEAATNSATIQWAANTEPDLAGYRVYHGTNSGVYGSSQSVGNSTSYQFVNLEGNKTHYFTVTAYDTSGNESSPASEVSKVITGTNADQVLSVTIDGNGTISSSPSGLACSNGVCSGAFSQGTTVTLSAHANSGDQFNGWGGSCSGTGNCSVTLSTSLSVSASFSTNTPVPSHTLSISLSGDGKGTVTSTPAGLSCPTTTCTGSFPQGTVVTLNPSVSTGSRFQGWNGVCSGTSQCQVTLMVPQVVTATFSTEDSAPPPQPKPTLPIKVNFQPPGSQIPTGFKKDDGRLFDTGRGYGWSQIVSGTDRNSSIDQTIDTFESISNLTPGTWNYNLPNGTYYLTMVLGDPQREQGPHWLTAEGLQLAKRVVTKRGEYLAIVDYPVVIKDGTLSIKLGGGSEGQTILNYLIIQETANLDQTWQLLAQSFGTNLVVQALNSGTVEKVNPTVLVKNALKEEAEKAREMAKLNRLKEKLSPEATSKEPVTLRNLLKGS